MVRKWPRRALCDLPPPPLHLAVHSLSSFDRSYCVHFRCYSNRLCSVEGFLLEGNGGAAGSGALSEPSYSPQTGEAPQTSPRFTSCLPLLPASASEVPSSGQETPPPSSASSSSGWGHMGPSCLPHACRLWGPRAALHSGLLGFLSVGFCSAVIRLSLHFWRDWERVLPLLTVVTTPGYAQQLGNGKSQLFQDRWDFREKWRLQPCHLWQDVFLLANI